MIDDRDEDSTDDIVHAGNEEMYRRVFALNTGHSMECIEETVNDMANMLSKVCSAYGNVPVDEILEQLTVDQFNVCLRKILASKECNCGAA